MPKQQFQTLFFIIRRMVYLVRTVSDALLYNQKDGLSSLTFLYTVVAYLPALIRWIEARPNDKVFK